MIIEIISLGLILIAIIFGIWRQKRLAVLNIKMYQNVTASLFKDYISKLSEVEGQILREINKNQKIQLELSDRVKVINKEVNSIQSEREKNIKSILEKLEVLDKQLTAITNKIKEENK